MAGTRSATKAFTVESWIPLAAPHSTTPTMTVETELVKASPGMAATRSGRASRMRPLMRSKSQPVARAVRLAPSWTAAAAMTCSLSPGALSVPLILLLPILVLRYAHAWASPACRPFSGVYGPVAGTDSFRSMDCPKWHVRAPNGHFQLARFETQYPSGRYARGRVYWPGFGSTRFVRQWRSDASLIRSARDASGMAASTPAISPRA